MPQNVLAFIPFAKEVLTNSQNQALEPLQSSARTQQRNRMTMENSAFLKQSNLDY